jgi:predicted nuclease of predicted toxin-antitoxin system
MARFLVDAQLSIRLSERLRIAGYEAPHVFEHLGPSASDRAIMDLANGLDAAIVSKDADFADLARSGLLHRTFVWIRIPNSRTELLWRACAPMLPAIVAAIADRQKMIEIR